MTKKIALILTMMATVLVMSTGVASASNLNCNATTTLKLHYNAGLAAGKSIVKQAWNGIGQDPTQFETFKAAVHNSIDALVSVFASQAPNDNLRCRVKGFAQGVCDQLGVVQTQAGNVCLLDGQAWGEFSAELYCALSISLGGLGTDGLLPNPPDGLCGSQFELGCDGSFVSFAERVPNLQNPALNECAEFTVAPWVAAYNESRANLCVY